MSSELELVQKVRQAWSGAKTAPNQSDYTLLAPLEGGFVGFSRLGLPSLIVPLASAPQDAAGRRAAGCEVVGHASTRLAYDGSDKVSPAAVLICVDPDLVDAFSVLVVDVAKRTSGVDANWPAFLACVEEWQALLSSQRAPSGEEEVGLWGELWFISQAADVDLLVSGWRGPDREAADFFLGGKAAEVKTSRKCRQHHVSRSQVDEPAGEHDAWLLSIWVKPDPMSRLTVGELVERVSQRARRSTEFLKRLARAGYRPSDKGAYNARFIVLAEPEWFRTDSVPRVRVADPGITHLRYRVTLDESKRAQPSDASELWHHFHGHQYDGGLR
jgi:hypothetical protein